MKKFPRKKVDVCVNRPLRQIDSTGSAKSKIKSNHKIYIARSKAHSVKLNLLRLAEKNIDWKTMVEIKKCNFGILRMKLDINRKQKQGSRSLCRS